MQCNSTPIVWPSGKKQALDQEVPGLSPAKALGGR